MIQQSFYLAPQQYRISKHLQSHKLKSFKKLNVIKYSLLAEQDTKIRSRLEWIFWWVFKVGLPNTPHWVFGYLNPDQY